MNKNNITKRLAPLALAGLTAVVYQANAAPVVEVTNYSGYQGNPNQSLLEFDITESDLNKVLSIAAIMDFYNLSGINNENYISQFGDIIDFNSSLPFLPISNGYTSTPINASLVYDSTILGDNLNLVTIANVKSTDKNTHINDYINVDFTVQNKVWGDTKSNVPIAIAVPADGVLAYFGMAFGLGLIASIYSRKNKKNKNQQKQGGSFVMFAVLEME